jgi:catechol 2,3-dioxygenase
MAISRFSYASINVMDVEAAARHYVHVVGLRETDRDADGRVYLQAADTQDHHCVILNPAKTAGVEHLGFKVNDPADLDEAAAAVAAYGQPVTRVPVGAVKGQGPGVRFPLPSGQHMLLYFHADKVGYVTGMENPNPVPLHSAPGGRVTHLDHTLISAQNPADDVKFLTEVLDFSLTEKVVDSAGNTLAAFLTCGHTMHDLAIGPGPDNYFHHMAFGMDSRTEVIHGVDLLKEKAVPALEYGITRHGIAGVTTIYFHDPSGNRNEFYNGAYLAPGAPDWVPPIVWQAEHFARGAFYYENAVPEAFFAEVT